MPCVTSNSSFTTATCTKARCISARRRRIGLRSGTRSTGLRMSCSSPSPSRTRMIRSFRCTVPRMWSMSSS